MWKIGFCLYVDLYLAATLYDIRRATEEKELNEEPEDESMSLYNTGESSNEERYQSYYDPDALRWQATLTESESSSWIATLAIGYMWESLPNTMRYALQEYRQAHTTLHTWLANLLLWTQTIRRS